MENHSSLSGTFDTATAADILYKVWKETLCSGAKSCRDDIISFHQRCIKAFESEQKMITLMRDVQTESWKLANPNPTNPFDAVPSFVNLPSTPQTFSLTEKMSQRVEDVCIESEEFSNSAEGIKAKEDRVAFNLNLEREQERESEEGGNSSRTASQGEQVTTSGATKRKRTEIEVE